MDDDSDLYDDTYDYNTQIGGAIPGTSAGAPNGNYNHAKVAPMTGVLSGIGKPRLMTSTGQRVDDAEPARPMTSNVASGYVNKSKQDLLADPINSLPGGGRGPAPPLADISDNGPEFKAKELEKKVNALLEESATAAAQVEGGDLMSALEKAKDAAKKERLLCKHREKHQLMEQLNLDLTYAVCLNLATCYHKNAMYQDALNCFGMIVKNKQYPNASRLRVNMGNIYFDQQKYIPAARMYRMALDQIPDNNKEIRKKIQRNIGNAMARSGQYQEAANAYEVVMEDTPDHQTAFNVLVCYYALGQVDNMQRTFQRLLSIEIMVAKDKDLIDDDGHEEDDSLTEFLQKREKKAVHYILNAAKLVAPMLNKDDWVAGYDWVIENLRSTQPIVSSELEIQKAIMFLKRNNFKAAADILKSFEKKDKDLMAKAATNLSFLYFLEGDIDLALTYANHAVKHQRYNAKALVNLGNCLFLQHDLERAKEVYLEGIGVEADCIQAIYNLGLVNKQLGVLKESLQAFEKLHSIVPHSAAVIYHIGNLYDLLDNTETSLKWFNILITRVPNDPGAHFRLGQLFSKAQDDTNAFHYHLEAHRYYPVNLDVISWLGVWFVKNNLHEKAIQFFNQACNIQPDEVKWKLMVTSCYRRMGNYVQAAQLYEQIHKKFPKNIECLRYLVAICRDMDTPYEKYQIALSKLERANIQQTMVAGAGRTFAGFGAGGPGGAGGGIGGGGGGVMSLAPGNAGARFSSFAEGESSLDESIELSVNLSESEPSPQRAGAAAIVGGGMFGAGGAGAPAPAPAPAAAPAPAPAPAKAAKKKKEVDSDEDWAVSDDDLPGFGSD